MGRYESASDDTSSYYSGCIDFTDEVPMNDTLGNAFLPPPPLPASEPVSKEEKSRRRQGFEKFRRNKTVRCESLKPQTSTVSPLVTAQTVTPSTRKRRRKRRTKRKKRRKSSLSKERRRSRCVEI